MEARARDFILLQLQYVTENPKP